jgi:hypothetical protein
MHKLLFQLVTFGKGGWTWEAVYNMPIHLRNFYMQQLSEFLALEAGKSNINGSGMKLIRS